MRLAKAALMKAIKPSVIASLHNQPWRASRASRGTARSPECDSRLAVEQLGDLQQLRDLGEAPFDLSPAHAVHAQRL
jgi:hypothetical protein